MIKLLNVSPENNTPKRLALLMSRMSAMTNDSFEIIDGDKCDVDAMFAVLFAKTHEAQYIVVDECKPAQYMAELLKELLFWYKVKGKASYTIKGIIVLSSVSCHINPFNFSDYLEIDAGLERRKALLDAQ